MSLTSGNNLGFLVLAIVLAAIWMARGGLDAESDSLQEPDALEIQNFTPRMLQKYNGVDDPRVLMGVNGKVYDVTAGKTHYGPGGPYASFAGRDASRGLAKHSFDAEVLNPIDAPVDELKDLIPEEREALQQWAQFFEGKYTYCGRLIDP